MAFLALVLIVCTMAPPLQGQVLDGNPDHVVRVALNLNSDAIDSGVIDKQLSRMGDAAAVATIKILSDKPLSVAEIDRVLFIIRMAFAAPQIVENEADREPRAALFVLRSLENRTSNSQQKKQLFELRKRLMR